MTSAPGLGHGGVPEAVPVDPAEQDGADMRAPARADGVQFIGEMSGSGYRQAPALVRRADGQTITLTPLLYLTLRALDGQQRYADVAQALSAATGRHVVPSDVQYLAESKLRPLGLLADADGSQPRTTKMNPLLALRLRFVITDQRLTRRLTAPFAFLFRPALVLGFVGCFLGITWWLFLEKGLGTAVHEAFYEPGMILVLWVLLIASAAFHEFGHAAACRYGGATPGAMGGGLYLVWPAFYTEVTDSYRLGKGARLRVDLGGLYFNAIFAVLTLALWAVTRWDSLLLVAVAQHLQMVRQLAPFIRADGYHIVADLTGVPDLFAHIKPTLQGVLPRRWRPTRQLALKRWARVVVVTWVFTMVPVLVGLITLGTLLLPRLAATAWDSANVQAEALTHYWSTGDMLGVLVRGLSAAIVFLPVLGLLYLLLRIVRGSGRWAWRAADDSPRGRAAVVLVGAAVAAGIAWAWWPAGQYQPVAADDRGRLTDVVQIEDRRIFVPLLVREATPMRTVALTDDATAAPPPATPMPVQPDATPRSEPPESASLPDSEPLTEARLADPGATASPDDGAVLTEPPLVDSPGTVTASGGGDPAAQGPAAVHALDAAVDQLIVTEIVDRVWPFPFAAPAPASEGDNRAEAVNTVDGSVVTDLAVAWALVTANEVDQQNKAWALASCEDCVTRAVAFQLLLLVSDSDVVVPVNSAVAANYDCTRCTTEAVAVQLVISLTGVPSPEAQALIGQAIARLELLEVELDELTAGQVRYVLDATQAELVQILEADGVIPELDTVSVAEESSEAVSSATATSDASASGEPSPTTEGSATAEPTPTADSSPSSSTTADPSPSSSTTADASPSPSPSPSTSADPSPSSSTSADPSPSSSSSPSSSPTADPSPSSSSSPSASGTAEPSSSPTADPSP